MNATEILVIILSIFLAVFLVAAIVLAILLIKVTLQIKRVTSAAERATANVEAMMMNVSRSTSQVVLGRLFIKQLRKLTKKKEQSYGKKK